ncbi:hypothetical protein LINGRAHAP2_LOCUS12910 [Linum grandiflorum]
MNCSYFGRVCYSWDRTSSCMRLVS